MSKEILHLNPDIRPSIYMARTLASELTPDYRSALENMYKGMKISFPDKIRTQIIKRKMRRVQRSGK